MVAAAPGHVGAPMVSEYKLMGQHEAVGTVWGEGVWGLEGAGVTVTVHDRAHRTVH